MEKLTELNQLESRSLTGCIKPFDGFGDIAAWIKKVELVARIKKIDDVAALIPLHLEGTAFEVYDQMDELQQLDAAAIKQRLREAFGQNRFAAYDAFRQRSWNPAEAVDAFLSDLRRLASLAGVESEKLICLAFVCGLPPDVSSQLRATARIGEADLQTILEMARVLMDERVQGAFAAGRPIRHHMNDSRQKLKCYRCGGDHLARSCRKRVDVTCWRCDQPGHIARYCTAGASSGNATGRLPAPAASQTE